MGKFSKKKIEEPEIHINKTCGFPNCKEKTDVYIKRYNITRCANHYMQDIDMAGKSQSQFVYKHGMPARWANN